MLPPPNTLVYLAGPMRGIPRYNFPAFDAAQQVLETAGLRVLSPAAMDRERGFDETKDVATPAFLAEAMRLDLDAILRVDALILLPGWERSTGATAEMHVAKWRGISIHLFPSGALLGDEDVLDEAKRITGGDRNRAYGHPAKNFGQTAALWNALKPGVNFTAKDVALFMIAVKLSRESHSPKTDNWTDIAGYARCGALCQHPEITL